MWIALLVGGALFLLGLLGVHKIPVWLLKCLMYPSVVLVAAGVVLCVIAWNDQRPRNYGTNEPVWGSDCPAGPRSC